MHRDGRVIWAQLNMSLVRRPTGEAEFLVAQIQDITERKVIERIKEEFVSVVSHELRAPLAAIRDALCGISALREIQMPEPARQLFDVCQSNCERLTVLVDEILDLEKLAAGNMQLDFRDESIGRHHAAGG